MLLTRACTHCASLQMPHPVPPCGHRAAIGGSMTPHKLREALVRKNLGATWRPHKLKGVGWGALRSVQADLPPPAKMICHWQLQSIFFGRMLCCRWSECSFNRALFRLRRCLLRLFEVLFVFLLRVLFLFMCVRVCVYFLCIIVCVALLCVCFLVRHYCFRRASSICVLHDAFTYDYSFRFRVLVFFCF